MLDVFQLVKDRGVPKPEGFDIDQKYLRGELANPIMRESGLNPIVGPGGGSLVRVIDDELAPGGGYTESGWGSPTDWEDPLTVDRWVNGANGYAADDAYASEVNTWPNFGSSIYYKDFGFSIPAGATIYGIEVKIDCYWTGAGVWPGRNTVYLTWGEFAGGTVTAWKFLMTDWPETNEATIIIGSNSDIWGRTWDASEFANGSFGVGIKPQGPYPYLSGNSLTAYIDWVRANIYYTT